MRLQRVATFSLLGMILCLVKQADAEPSFARKYQADCTLCHTIYPRLNRVGYEFRRHGYRFLTNAPATTAPETHAQPVAPAAESVAQGRRTVTQIGCRTCHSIEGSGGHVGPSLDGVGARQTPDYLAIQIATPATHNPSTVMPEAHLDPGQLSAVVSYLTSLQASAKEHHEPKVLDYVGAIWVPAIRLSSSAGEVDASYDTRELTLFVAGTLGQNFSVFLESDPTSQQAGFAQKWGEAQGVFNTSGSVDYAQIRAGQLLGFQGSGFGSTDRVFSDSFPLIYSSVNGYALARYLRGSSGEYTFGEGTTVKVLGGESSDHSRSVGGVFEQVIGRTGLSGISVEYADAWNPLFGDSGGTPELHLQRYIFAGNKTFQDSRNRERVNLIGAMMLGRDNYLVNGDLNRGNHSYGYYGEVDGVAIPRHLGFFLRYDALRPTMQQPASMHAGAVGATIDVTHFARLLLEYQRFDFTSASNFYTVGFRLNF